MSRVPRVLALAALLLSAPVAAGPEAGKLAGAAEGKPFSVSVGRLSAKKGEPATTQVVVTAAKGYHLNKDYPPSLKLTLPAGVSAKKAALTKADAVLGETEGRFEVVLTSAEAGKKSVSGDLRFAVCTETTCDPQRSAVTIEMDVK